MSHDLTKIAERLRAALPGSRIDGLRPLATGFSNETYLVEGPDLILRLPPFAGAMVNGFDVIGQATVYRALGEVPGGPAVPRILAVSEEAEPPFFVMERVSGEAIDDIAMQPWFADADPAERGRICRVWIETFARNARLAPVAALGAVQSPEQHLRSWRQFALAARSHETVTAIDRLLQRPAPLSGPPTVVHGDPKLSNLMWHDGRVSAVLDWEMALNGEPLGDLAYMLYGFESRFHPPTRAQKLPGMLTREEVIAEWEQVTGRSSQGVEWHEIAQFCKLCAIVAEGVNMRESGRSSDPKLAYFQASLDNWIGITRTMLDEAGL